MGPDSPKGQPYLGVHQVLGEGHVPQYKKDVKPLKSVERRATKMVKDVERKTDEEWPRFFGLYSAEQKGTFFWK